MIAQALLVYCMSVVLFSLNTCKARQIQVILLVSIGLLGTNYVLQRNMVKWAFGISIAMLGKQGWRFISNPNSLPSRIFKANYFSRDIFMIICAANNLLLRSTRWRFGNGRSISVFNDLWLDDNSNLHINTTPLPSMENLRANELL
ncbi:RNA-directed DNA polymerase [Gossypium australe]|uniref:RNA-directed DNA polymerase n=1 Tax=Gossypium australe TaxID=47621 RepID=A0A5B6WQN6_9ROSI|nr:RNA-directed DNA polymerase [Gossypium australe]